VRVLVPEAQGLIEESRLDVLEDPGHTRRDLRQGNGALLLRHPVHEDHLAGRDVTGAELDPDGNALEFPLAELVAGPMLIAIVELDPHPVAGEIIA
jgi:hypothetical protein